MQQSGDPQFLKGFRTSNHCAETPATSLAEIMYEELAGRTSFKFQCDSPNAVILVGHSNVLMWSRVEVLREAGFFAGSLTTQEELNTAVPRKRALTILCESVDNNASKLIKARLRRYAMGSILRLVAPLQKEGDCDENERLLIPSLLPTSAIVSTVGQMMAQDLPPAGTCTLALLLGSDAQSLAAKSALLKTQGFVVVTAFSVREAHEFFKYGDFDVAVLDPSLNEADGDQFTRLIRASGSHIPIVAVVSAPDFTGTFAEGITTLADSLNLAAGLRNTLRRVHLLAVSTSKTETPARKLQPSVVSIRPHKFDNKDRGGVSAAS